MSFKISTLKQAIPSPLCSIIDPFMKHTRILATPNALNSWCFKEDGDSRTVAFDVKVENPWSETKTKHVPELLVLKTEVIIIFLDYACFVNEC